jgi:hypothetical protein
MDDHQGSVFMLAVILALKLPTILILAWAFSRPFGFDRTGVP